MNIKKQAGQPSRRGLFHQLPIPTGPREVLWAFGEGAAAVGALSLWSTLAAHCPGLRPPLTQLPPAEQSS